MIVTKEGEKQSFLTIQKLQLLAPYFNVVLNPKPLHYHWIL